MAYEGVGLPAYSTPGVPGICYRQALDLSIHLSVFLSNHFSVCLSICLHTRMCFHIYIYMDMYIRIHVEHTGGVYACVYVYACACVYMYICIRICMFICRHVYGYVHGHRSCPSGALDLQIDGQAKLLMFIAERREAQVQRSKPALLVGPSPSSPAYLMDFLTSFKGF